MNAARRQTRELDRNQSAFKKVFMASLVVSIGPLVRLLAAVGAISSLMLLGLMNLVP